MTEEMAKIDTSVFGALDAELDHDTGFNPIPVQVKINHQGSLFDLSGIGTLDMLEIVVLAAMRVRTFFPNMGSKDVTKTILEFTGNRPLCSSQDYVNGVLIDANWENAPEAASMLKGKIAEGALVCAEGHCPLNAWNSVKLLGKDGRGKACAELRRLCIWKPGWNIPVILSAPTSSVRAWDEYCSSLVLKDFKPHYVYTRMSLESKSGGGQNYSVIKFQYVNTIGEKERNELLTKVNLRGVEASLIKSLVDVFKRRALTVEDYPATPTNGTGDGVDADDLAEDF